MPMLGWMRLPFWLLLIFCSLACNHPVSAEEIRDYYAEPGLNPFKDAVNQHYRCDAPQAAAEPAAKRPVEMTPAQVQDAPQSTPGVFMPPPTAAIGSSPAPEGERRQRFVLEYFYSPTRRDPSSAAVQFVLLDTLPSLAVEM